MTAHAANAAALACPGPVTPNGAAAPARTGRAPAPLIPALKVGFTWIDRAEMAEGSGYLAAGWQTGHIVLAEHPEQPGDYLPGAIFVRDVITGRVVEIRDGTNRYDRMCADIINSYRVRWDALWIQHKQKPFIGVVPEPVAATVLKADVVVTPLLRMLERTAEQAARMGYADEAEAIVRRGIAKASEAAQS